MRKVWTSILVIIIIILVGVSAYLFGQNQQKSTAVVDEISITPDSGMVVPSFAPEVLASPAAANNPVVIIESEESIPTADVIELKERIINPFIDYTANTQLPVESIKISKYTGEIKDEYPYQADIVYVGGDGKTLGFLIKRQSGHIAWFYPDCMNGCNFSDSFKEKYPEIVKLSQ